MSNKKGNKKAEPIKPEPKKPEPKKAVLPSVEPKKVELPKPEPKKVVPIVVAAIRNPNEPLCKTCKDKNCKAVMDSMMTGSMSCPKYKP